MEPEYKCLTAGDRAAILVGKVVIGWTILWFATSVARPFLENTYVTVTVGGKKGREDA